ncbi:MAG: hypothetical protein ACRDNA_05955, partial [Gaiellaceae bacterium]
MRRGTWLVIGAVAAIALAAAFDSLRGGDETPASPPATTAEQTTTGAVPADAEPAQQAAFGGVLYYTDESCELRAVRLPTREPAEAPNWDECSFVLSPDGTRASGAGSGWDPHSDPRIGRLFEFADGRIQISSNLGPEGEPIRGSAAAWRPDGMLTYFADGAVREWPGGDVLIPRAALVQGAMSHINAPATRPGLIRAVQVEELVWLDSERAVVTIRARVPNGVNLDLAAVYDGRRRVATVDALAPITSLWAGPQGRSWAMEADGLQVYDRDGGALPVPPLTEPRAVAWSPDESWIAVATRASVFVFQAGEPGARIRQFPIVANDLAWRGMAEPPPLADAVEARAWLGGVRATGRLFVTDPGCRLRALRLPDLVWEGEPDGERAPCRFALDATDEAVAEAISVAPGGQLRATCRDGRLAVFGSQGRTADIPDACAPAWMPDGTLTFVRGGELWRGTVEPRRLITRAELRDMFGRDAALEEVAWFDDERLWAVVRVGSSDAIALMTLSRLVYSPTFTAPRIEGLQVSPTGMVAARTDT